jgi:hypothetical protein
MATNLRQSLSILTCAAFVLCLSLAAYGQNREKFVISAKAGGINAVTGRAKVHLKGGSDWQQLSVTDDLEAGDVVRTEGGGRVEMLLNPGSYLRLGENSEFELVNSSLDNLELRLVRGTAIVEATGTDDTELMINITTPHTKLAIVRHGLYRLNVVPEDATELIVRKGRVMLNDDSHTKVKGGNKVVISATSQSMAKLTGDQKKANDDVEFWSKERAEALAKANRRINDRMLASAFSNSDWLFGSHRSAGFWFFNSTSRCYTFLPFYYGWGSPYGGSYSIAIYNPFFYNPRGGYYGYPNNGVTYNPRPYPSNGVVSAPRGDISSAPGPAPTRQPDPIMSSPGARPTRDAMIDSPGRSIGKPDIRPDVRQDRPNQ